MATNKEKSVKCSFCGKSQDGVDRIIAGPGVYICNECVKVCSNIIEDDLYEDTELTYTLNEDAVLPSPAEIKAVLDTYVIGQEEAKKTLNKDLEISSEGLAIIPTEYNTEILCYEFKGKVDDREFLVYINAENGREEDILIITNTPNGTLTM